MRYFLEIAPICVRGDELTCASYFCGAFEFLLFSFFWTFSFFWMLRPFLVAAFCMVLLTAVLPALMLFLVAMSGAMAVPSLQSL
jgi:hypothetical protein